MERSPHLPSGQVTTAAPPSSTPPSSTFSTSSSASHTAVPFSSSSTTTPSLTPDKRKRSRSTDTVAAKAQKAHHPHVLVNYLTRQSQTDLPLVTIDHSLASISQNVTDYHAVLDRRESLAGNLGARPLGPILMNRFDRLFESAPTILKSNSKEHHVAISWFDVIDFARSKPDQFTLSQMSEGARVCQFYTKQCRVQISEEDFFLITSGIPHKIIPPQPIPEDEDKELETVDALEMALSDINQLADQVLARGRLLVSRLQSRRRAILDRRESCKPPLHSSIPQTHLPSNPSLSQASLPSAGSRPSTDKSGIPPSPDLGKSFQVGPPPPSDASSRLASIRPALSDKDRLFQPGPGTYHITSPFGSQSSPLPYLPLTPAPRTSADISTATILNTTTRQLKSRSGNKDFENQPFKAVILSRTDALSRGDRIMPPCDRCRRLHMDCIKNLTACVGCTKKHAKCSWWDVKPGELASEDGSSLALAPTSASSSSGCLPPTSPLLTSPDVGFGADPSARYHSSTATRRHQIANINPDPSSDGNSVPTPFSYPTGDSVGVAPFRATVAPASAPLSSDNSGTATLTDLSEFGIGSLGKYTSGVESDGAQPSSSGVVELDSPHRGLSQPSAHMAGQSQHHPQGPLVHHQGQHPVHRVQGRRLNNLASQSPLHPLQSCGTNSATTDQMKVIHEYRVVETPSAGGLVNGLRRDAVNGYGSANGNGNGNGNGGARGNTSSSRQGKGAVHDQPAATLSHPRPQQQQQQHTSIHHPSRLIQQPRQHSQPGHAAASSNAHSRPCSSLSVDSSGG